MGSHAQRVGAAYEAAEHPSLLPPPGGRRTCMDEALRAGGHPFDLRAPLSLRFELVCVVGSEAASYLSLGLELPASLQRSWATSAVGLTCPLLSPNKL